MGKGIDMGRNKVEEVYDVHLTKDNETFEIYENTISVLTIVYLKLKSDIQKGIIKTEKDFDRLFSKYYRILSENNASDFIKLPADWSYGIGANCTGRDDVASSLGLDSTPDFGDNSDERVCELLTTLDTDDKLRSFLALSKNSSKINQVAQNVLTSFTQTHHYVTLDEYVAPVRNQNFMTAERESIYQDIENTFGKFACYASKSTMSYGDNKKSKINKKGVGSNRIAYISDNAQISIKGYENRKRSTFLDFICILDESDTRLGKYDGMENELISFFEGEELADKLLVNYESLERVSNNDIREFDKLLEPIAKHYGYKLKDRYEKHGVTLRDEFVTDMFNLYSLATGNLSKFKTVDDYMVSMSRVSPFDAQEATVAKCYYNLCKEFRNDTIDRVEYYKGVVIGK